MLAIRLGIKGDNYRYQKIKYLVLIYNHDYKKSKTLLLYITKVFKFY